MPVAISTKDCLFQSFEENSTHKLYRMSLCLHMTNGMLQLNIISPIYSTLEGD